MKHKITTKQRNNLLEAARLIEANPEHFDMRSWFCNTAACIGGWSVMVDLGCDTLLGARDWWFGLRTPQAYTAIKRATGLDWGEVWLFSSSNWFDCEAARQFRKANSTKAQAKAAADYVRWFVENHTQVEDSK